MSNVKLLEIELEEKLKKLEDKESGSNEGWLKIKQDFIGFW